MKDLRKILWSDRSRAHLLWAFLGTFAGFVLLLSGLHFYLELKQVLSENRDLLDPEYIILNKKVDLGQTLGLSSKGFSEEEITDLEAQGFADQVDPFISNLFPIRGYADSDRIPGFYSELFFEAVPDQYIDIKSEDWSWDPDEGVIPIIIPQDFLNLYNFGFAQSQGLPQIPKGVLSMVSFRIRLTDRMGLHEEFPGKIVGFSNRIHSILVPHNFLTWANQGFGYFEDREPSRLILVSGDPTNPAIIRYLEEKGFDTIREKLKSSRMNIILKFIISFLVVVAAIIIALAFLVFLLSLQLMISRSSSRIIRLNKLGFHHREISRPYITLLLLLTGGVTALSIMATSLIAHVFSNTADAWSLHISGSLGGHIYMVALGLIVLISSANILAIRISTKKLCN